MSALTAVVVVVVERRRKRSKLSMQFSWNRCEQLSSTSLLLALPPLTAPPVDDC
jgi:hypothetical protein